MENCLVAAPEHRAVSESVDRDPAVQRLLDKDEIVDLVHRYSYLVDLGRHEELVELFTDDCVIDYGRGLAPLISGKDAFRALFERGPTGTPVQSHHNANVIITFDDPDRASVLTSVYAWHELHDGTNPRIWGYYHDVAVRTDDGWRLASRQLRIAGQQDWDIDWLPLDPARG